MLHKNFAFTGLWLLRDPYLFIMDLQNATYITESAADMNDIRTVDIYR